MSFILVLLINAVAVMLAAYLLEGVTVKNFWHALLTAILLSIVNTVIKPVLTFLSIPFVVLTLGLFIWVINALLLMLVDAILPGLKIRNFWWALGMAIVLAIINGVLGWVFGL